MHACCLEHSYFPHTHFPHIEVWGANRTFRSESSGPVVLKSSREQVAPPQWAQCGMVLAITASAVTWVYVTPLYFVAGGPYSEKGGLDGAIEVVQ